jgi:hypothetical protein
MAKHKGRAMADPAIALALAGGKTIAQTATACGVSERTINTRLKDQKFVRLIRQQRRAMSDRCAGKLADGLDEAVDVIRELLKSASEYVRLRAAGRLIELKLKVADMSALQNRVAQLEHRIATAPDLAAAREVGHDDLRRMATQAAQAALADTSWMPPTPSPPERPRDDPADAVAPAPL